jgi:hypothetical protein
MRVCIIAASRSAQLPRPRALSGPPARSGVSRRLSAASKRSASHLIRSGERARHHSITRPLKYSPYLVSSGPYSMGVQGIASHAQPYRYGGLYGLHKHASGASSMPSCVVIQTHTLGAVQLRCGPGGSNSHPQLLFFGLVWCCTRVESNLENPGKRLSYPLHGVQLNVDAIRCSWTGRYGCNRADHLVSTDACQAPSVVVQPLVVGVPPTPNTTSSQHAGRPDLIRSPRLVLAHVWEGVDCKSPSQDGKRASSSSVVRIACA